MQLFYVGKREGTWAWLSEEESKHVMRVLRKKVGDELALMDGRGTFYKGRIHEVKGKVCVVRIESQREIPRPEPHIHLAVAPTKQNDRLEWLLEKATEIGVSEISLFFSEHSERRKYRVDRGERVILSAAKQSLKAWLPVLHSPITFEEMIRASHWNSYSLRAVATCLDIGNKQLLADCLLRTSPGQVALLIGPEGDFSPEEIDRARGAGFQPLSLGDSRLRTETAGLVAVHTVQLLANLPRAGMDSSAE